MVVPEGVDLQSADGWAVVINYDDAGHINDDDASSTDFNDLLKTMQKQTDEQNPNRQKAGYDPVTLVGWAEPPHYDSSAKTVYWAEQLKFGDSKVDTLNYKIRVLGREGVLIMNVVDSIDHLERIRKLSPTLLTMASFNSGKTYADFKSGDHMAGIRHRRADRRRRAAQDRTIEGSAGGAGGAVEANCPRCRSPGCWLRPVLPPRPSHQAGSLIF